MICTNPRNSAFWLMYRQPRHSIVRTSQSAECTALRENTMPIAPSTASGARIQNAISSAPGSVFGAAVAVSAAAWTMRWRADITPIPPRPASQAQRPGRGSGAGADDSLAGARSCLPLRPDPVGRGADTAAGRRLPDQLGTQGVVVVLVTQPHRVRRLLHAGQQRGQQHVLGVDQPLPVVVGQLVLVRHGEGPGRAGLDAQAAADAAQVVDLVVLAVPLTRREALLFGVVAALHEDRVGRAGPRAQLAADTLLQAVRVPVQ